MSIPHELELSEVVANAIVELLEAELPSAIEEVNTSLTDGIELKMPVQIVPYIATEATTEAGMPIVGVADLPIEFEDDLVSSLTAQHRYYVHVVAQDSDHATLVKLLRRYVRAIVVAIQKDRTKPLHGEVPILGREATWVWATMFESVQPGPLLGDQDPHAPDAPPTSWLSWSGVVISLRRQEA